MGNKDVGKSEKRITCFYISAVFKRCIRCNIMRRLIIWKLSYYYYYYYY